MEFKKGANKMITIIAKKAFKFVLRDKENAVVDTKLVRPGILTRLPAWVKDDALFKLAEKDESITFVESPNVTAVALPKTDEPPKVEDKSKDDAPPADDEPPKVDDDQTKNDEPPKTGRGQRKV